MTKYNRNEHAVIFIESMYKLLPECDIQIKPNRYSIKGPFPFSYIVSLTEDKILREIEVIYHVPTSTFSSNRTPFDSGYWHYNPNTFAFMVYQFMKSKYSIWKDEDE